MRTRTGMTNNQHPRPPFLDDLAEAERRDREQTR